MKKPIINEFQRYEMNYNTYYSNSIKLHLAWLHFKRDVERLFYKQNKTK